MWESFCLKYWKQIAEVLIVGTLVYSGYTYIYDRGVTATSTKYEQTFKAYTEKLDARIGTLEDLSKGIVNQNVVNSQTTSKQISNILLAVKVKPLYVVKEGKCTPSKDFIDGYNSLISGGIPK